MAASQKHREEAVPEQGKHPRGPRTLSWLLPEAGVGGEAEGGVQPYTGWIKEPWAELESLSQESRAMVEGPGRPR